MPVWLVGTSASTISAVSVAARFPDPKSGGPDGIVLTSSLTVLAKGLCGRSIYFAPLANIRVPIGQVCSICWSPRSSTSSTQC
jgi:hypothetical protein